MGHLILYDEHTGKWADDIVVHAAPGETKSPSKSKGRDKKHTPKGGSTKGDGKGRDTFKRSKAEHDAWSKFQPCIFAYRGTECIYDNCKFDHEPTSWTEEMKEKMKKLVALKDGTTVSYAAPAPSSYDSNEARFELQAMAQDYANECWHACTEPVQAGAPPMLCPLHLVTDCTVSGCHASHPTDDMFGNYALCAATSAYMFGRKSMFNNRVNKYNNGKSNGQQAFAIRDKDRDDNNDGHQRSGWGHKSPRSDGERRDRGSDGERRDRGSDGERRDSGRNRRPRSYDRNSGRDRRDDRKDDRNRDYDRNHRDNRRNESRNSGRASSVESDRFPSTWQGDKFTRKRPVSKSRREYKEDLNLRGFKAYDGAHRGRSQGFNGRPGRAWTPSHTPNGFKNFVRKDGRRRTPHEQVRSYSRIREERFRRGRSPMQGQSPRPMISSALRPRSQSRGRKRGDALAAIENGEVSENY